MGEKEVGMPFSPKNRTSVNQKPKKAVALYTSR
jgi:hypothetical protein